MEVGAGGEHLVQTQLSLVHRLQGQQGGHDLGDAGGIHVLVGILGVENLPVVHVHQDSGPRLDVQAGQQGAPPVGLGGVAGEGGKVRPGGLDLILGGGGGLRGGLRRPLGGGGEGEQAHGQGQRGKKCRQA